jgi:hypothetical protein
LSLYDAARSRCTYSRCSIVDDNVVDSVRFNSFSQNILKAKKKDKGSRKWINARISRMWARNRLYIDASNITHKGENASKSLSNRDSLISHFVHSFSLTGSSPMFHQHITFLVLLDHFLIKFLLFFRHLSPLLIIFVI